MSDATTAMPGLPDRNQFAAEFGPVIAVQDHGLQIIGYGGLWRVKYGGR